MSAPHESGHDDHQLVQYLLGLLPDEDAEHIDEMSIVDEDVATRLAVVENDLIDAYVRGTMADDTRERFASVYLATPRRREKVRFAERFVHAVDRAAVNIDTRDVSLQEPAVEPLDVSPRISPPGRTVPRSMPWWGLVLAVAAALVLITGGWLLFNEVRLRNELLEARNTGAALERRAHELEQQLNDGRSAHAATMKELERVRASLAELTEPSSPGGPGQGASASAPAMVALVLPPQTRAGGPIATMAVPGGAAGVAFDLQLEANDFSQYEAAVEDPATNRIVWRSGRIAARSVRDLPVVSIIVPAGELKSQRYSLELTGYGPGGGAQLVSGYSFRIVRR